jgi:hypothetical protein
MRASAAAMMLMAVCSTCATVAAQESETQSQTGFTDALVPVEVLAPESNFKGEIRGFGFRWNYIVIAEQPARVWRAVIAQEPAGAGVRQVVLNLAMLGPVRADASGRLVTDLPPDQLAWCESDSRKRATIRCFQDLDADGKLEMLRSGLLPTLDAVAVNRVSVAQPTTPIPYREARADELPRMLLQYISCPERESIYKYATMIQHLDADGSRGARYSGECTEAATSLPGEASARSLYQFGRFKVSTQEEGTKTISTLTEGIPAGTLLGHVRADRPFIDAVQAKSYREDRNAISGGLPFLYFVTPPQVASAAAAPGTEIVSAEVAHGITSRLSAPLTTLGFLGGRKDELPVGTPMYGMLMSNTKAHPNLDPEIVWCIPGSAQDGSRCVTRGQVGHKLVRNFERFNIGTLSVGSSDQSVLPPLVERQPVEFGAPIHLSIKFAKWDKRYALLEFSFGFETEHQYRRMRLRRASDGAAYLFVGGTFIKLLPAASDPTNVSLEYRGGIEAGSDAQPMDAHELQKMIAAGR